MKNNKTIVYNDEGREILLESSDYINTEKFTPLSIRIEKNKPYLIEPLKKLKNHIGDNDFEKYFNTLLDIKVHEKYMIISTDKNINRTIIIDKFMSEIKDIFDVDKVRVIVQ